MRTSSESAAAPVPPHAARRTSPARCACVCRTAGWRGAQLRRPTRLCQSLPLATPPHQTATLPNLAPAPPRPRKPLAVRRCLQRGHLHTWMAFIDVDEFLMFR
jgi:hypothetical protein